jgi:hypothetical protein
MQSSWAHNWSEFSTELIIGGKTADGVPYLKLFLLDYKKQFNVETLNAACQKCIYQYHRDFIKQTSTMENTSKYQLHKKREGIQLEFGGSLFITNENITDRYAEKLIKRFKEINPDFKLEDLFEVFPTEEIKQVAETPKKQPRKPRK